MMKIQRIYVDNSVIGGYFDAEFEEDTKKLFDRPDFRFVVSDLTEQELLPAPQRVRNLLKGLDINYDIVEVNEEAVLLADKYIKEEIIGPANRNDCLHIATATIAKVDILVSWNFKHIVNLGRIRGYNGVNLKNGYSTIEIRSPREVINI